jgi:hypothetical protein
MIRIRLDAPTLRREIEVASVDDLIEAEGLTWMHDGEADGLPRYVPAASG